MRFEETQPVDPKQIDEYLTCHPETTHVSVVHCETTTGVLNPLADIAAVVKKHGKTLIVDAMSSFGGVPVDMAALGIDFMISSANKCIQGVPGFGFIIARRSLLEGCKALPARCRSTCMTSGRRWRADTASGASLLPLTWCALHAGTEGTEGRRRCGGTPCTLRENHRTLVEGMRSLGYKTLLPDEEQSPVITSFYYPSADFNFKDFYTKLKAKGFVIYPGKISQADTFRIAT